MGNGSITLLPGGDIQAAIDQAALVAGLVSNPVHTLPGPAPLPEVELVDPELERDMSGTLQALMEKMRSAALKPGVRMTAAECFGELETSRLVNSRGIDAQQEMTRVDMEFGCAEGRAWWNLREMTRRQHREIETQIEQKSLHTLELLEAGTRPGGAGGAGRAWPVSWRG
jgi:predicted Zn-dependent protease